jgi:xanthine dehydrogenase accessory factor
MSDLGEVLAVWREAESSGEDYVVATIVGVRGSSYRKPGARMIVTENGRRAGTLSGGCLEGEVAKKAWWLTENGPTVQSYTTRFDIDEEIPYGSGCGGTIHVLLERRNNATAMMHALARAFDARTPLGIATVLEGANAGTRVIAGESSIASLWHDDLEELAKRALVEEKTFAIQSKIDSSLTKLSVEFVPARSGLFIFGAGDDIRPLVTQARTLGWHITVADGRSNLAMRERFLDADDVVVLRRSGIQHLEMKATDAAVLMTHSWEQDRELLRQLLPRTLRYLGVLGPRQRTVQLVAELTSGTECSVAEYMDMVHAPIGLNIGSDSPARIALSVIAQIEATLNQRNRFGRAATTFEHLSLMPEDPAGRRAIRYSDSETGGEA